MSGSSMASVASTNDRVPTGPNTVSGLGRKDIAQRMVMMSLRSVMWSLCRWVRNTARRALAPVAAPAARISTPRPQSNRRSPEEVRTKVAGPARLGSGRGLPLPRTTTFTGHTPSTDGWVLDRSRPEANSASRPERRRAGQAAEGDRGLFEAGSAGEDREVGGFRGGFRRGRPVRPPDPRLSRSPLQSAATPGAGTAMPPARNSRARRRAGRRCRARRHPVRPASIETARR